MAAEKHQPGKAKTQGDRAPAKGEHTRPEWAEGLRALYDSVVDEPLPDSFKDLLDRLDDPTPNGTS
ncbi:NepR family anti-sigma factor [Altererythrobacter sp. Z27]|uniref:NepR family anti-sigma factor n=1 Tax=Altererythrobacter sp. Z27 TaxID=3461147 RepID=UPI00404486BD